MHAKWRWCLSIAGCAASVAIGVGPGCNDGSKTAVPALCSSDADCGAGQGCLIVSVLDHYCAPLCQTDATCPAKMACPLYDLIVSDEPPTCRYNDASGTWLCALYERNYGPTSCPEAGTGGSWGNGGYGGDSEWGFTGAGGSSGGASGTSTSCALSNCSRNGFSYSCASSSSQTSTQYNYDSAGNLTGWTKTVSYSNGDSVTCVSSASSGSCTGSGSAACTW